jgi:hypothetical protein
MYNIPGVFKKIGDAIVEKDELSSFTAQNNANMIWAYATANKQHPGLFKDVANKITQPSELKSYNAQDLANIAWSYTVANEDAPAVFKDFFTEALLDKQNGLIADVLRQLYQWHLWQTKEMSCDGLPHVLQNRCHQTFIEEDFIVSTLQKDVVKQLVLIWLNLVEEFSD